uniref:Peptidase metallopeptidase domain-containing protein n=1 Tax=Monopterus albus TaxID=43700 RepID=A0A3Q3QP03_MONAL
MSEGTIHKILVAIPVHYPNSKIFFKDSSLLSEIEYLQKFYNLPKKPSGRIRRSGPSFTSKVKDMQSFFGLNATGVLDSETLEVMRSPRCGVPDVEEYSNAQGTRWNKNIITYRYLLYTRDLPRSTVDFLLETAFRVWARASSLTFVRMHSHNADIMVEFVTSDHGDLYPFDGPRGTLAHAFGPGLGVGGDTHFDDDERWTTGKTGFNLHVVAAHEFGHALGLKHSRNPESLMYPTYKGHSNYLSRYNWSSHPWLSGSLFPQLMQKKCAPDLTFDAVTTIGEATFFFRKRYFDNFHSKEITHMFNLIQYILPLIESIFWTVKGSFAKGKPRSLSHFGFPASVQDIDAAVHIVKTGRTLFFIQDNYWSYNENRRVMDFGYPKNISEGFPGVNATINAAVYKEGLIYFFVGPQVYKYDYTHKHVVGVEKANSWLGC